jgi:hypothetical protein
VNAPTRHNLTEKDIYVELFVQPSSHGARGRPVTPEKNGMRWNLAADYLLYGECFLRKGDRSHARENLNKAIQIFQECGARGWVKRTEEKLAKL